MDLYSIIHHFNFVTTKCNAQQNKVAWLSCLISTDVICIYHSKYILHGQLFDVNLNTSVNAESDDKVDNATFHIDISIDDSKNPF